MTRLMILATTALLAVVGLSPGLVVEQKPPGGTRETTTDGTALRAAAPVPPGTKAEAARGALMRRTAPVEGEKGTQLLTARLVLNDHGTNQDRRVFSVGVEVENLSGHGVNLEFDPKDLKLELLDSARKAVAVTQAPRSGPVPLTHSGVLPTSGYIGFSTYRGGIGLPPEGLLLAAGWQDWHLKPGDYRLRGSVTVSAAFGHVPLDPLKPTRPAPKQADKHLRAPLRITLDLAETPLFALPGK